jgi:hypothetical protein
MTTTALVAAGLIGSASTAGAIELKLGGWQEGIIGAADQSNKNTTLRKTTGFDAQADGEIHFKSSGTLDNGLKVRTRVELESSTSADQIDEAYLDVSGKWGAIRIGSEDNAAHLMETPTHGAWATNAGQNLFFDITDWILVPSGFGRNGTQRLELGEGDAEKVSYFTPRIGGLQVGVSYMPNGEEDKNGSIAGTTVAAGAGAIVHGWAAATNYRGKFGGVGVGLAAGYASANHPGGQTGPDFEGDPKGWNASGSVSFAGVTLAAGYTQRASIGGDGTGSNGAGNGLSFGAMYDFGMNHVSAGYAREEQHGKKSNTKDDESDRVLISYRRDLAKGVQYRLNLMYADFKGEDVGKSDDNEGVAVTTSVRVAF